LPTDRKLKEISDDGLKILYHNWLRTVPEDSFKAKYWKQKLEEAQEDDPEVKEQLVSLGYDLATVEEIMKEMKRAST
jgi:hypothetical protein